MEFLLLDFVSIGCVWDTARGGRDTWRILYGLRQVLLGSQGISVHGVYRKCIN